MEQLQWTGLGKTAITPKPSLCVIGSLKPTKHGFSHLSPTRRRLVVTCSHSDRKRGPRGKAAVQVKGKKDNVWSVDNDAARAESEREREARSKGRRRMRKRRGGGHGGKVGDKVMVSGSMLVEVETVLQTQEPVIRPIWNTFASSVSGIWKGVGAVFSPITAQMEPIEVGSNGENLYDCYTLDRVESSPAQIRRKVNWVTLNPYGEQVATPRDGASSTGPVLPHYDSFNFGTSDVMEEDVMDHEPGLVVFEDGSYSRGPVELPVGDVDDSQYYLSPVFKFEQCLVKGCHRRLRIVHTIEFGEGGSDIQIMRVAVYEEQWVSPANIPETSDTEFDMKPFSQRRRTQPSELSGSWKVFEVSATPVFGGTMLTDGSGHGAPYVYLCTETLKKRSLPENPVYFGEEEMVDMQDVTILWLPGGVTGYVDVSKDGILCIGVGWYSDEGVNLVMERDYGADGKLEEVRHKTEVKRRWSDPIQT